jgi:hypothetical protein
MSSSKFTTFVTNKYAILSSIALILVFMFAAQTISTMYDVKLNNTFDEFIEYKDAIVKFYDEYGYLPGDFPNASKHWPGANNGNGNHRVEELMLEDIYVWHHLSLAGLIEKQYNGRTDYANRQYIAGSNVPKSKEFSYSIFAFRNVDNKVYTTKGHALILGRLDKRGYPTTGAISSKDAATIDERFDDGIASNGKFQVIPTENTNGCIEKDLTGYYAKYLRTEKPQDCIVYFWVLKDE